MGSRSARPPPSWKEHHGHHGLLEESPKLIVGDVGAQVTRKTRRRGIEGASDAAEVSKKLREAVKAAAVQYGAPSPFVWRLELRTAGRLQGG